MTPPLGASTPDSAGPRFALTHLWAPLAVFSLLLAVIAAGDIDTSLADGLYTWEGHRWALRQTFGTEVLVHRAGRDLSLLAWCTVFGTWLFSLRHEAWRPWRKPLGYLVASTLAATALVAWIKGWSNMDCPWDLARYGGARPFVGLFELRPVGLGRGVCFPAGHASGGYAWVALYFFFAAIRPRWRWWGLAAGLSVGLLFGISQQLRGAHFLSHDVWALGICWTTAALMSLAFWHAPARDPAAAEDVRTALQ